MPPQVDIFRRSLQLCGLNQLRSFSHVAETKTIEESEGHFHLQEWAKARPFSEVPGPTRFQLIRGILPGGIFHKKPYSEFVEISQRKWGDLVNIPGVFGKQGMILSFNPDDFATVIRSEGIWPKRQLLDTIYYHRTVHRKDAYQGTIGLINSNDEEWGRIRTIVNPVLMQPRTVRLYFNKMLDVSNQFLERIREIRDPDTLEMPDTFENDINHLAFESVSVVALNQQVGLLRKDMKNEDAEELFLCLGKLIQMLYELDIMPSMWKLVKTPKFHQMMNNLDRMHEIITRFVNAALERIEKSSTETPEREKSVFEKLLKIDKNIAVVMAFDLLMVGVDTTSSSFAGILLGIAKNPEKQEKLRQELRTILPTKDSRLTAESMKNLPYLRACIKEGLRIHPLTVGTFRSNQLDLVLSGYQIPRDQMIVPVTGLALKDDKYVPRAKEFIPERWLRGNNEHLAPSNPFLHIPFGFGPRSCVGKRFVDLELEITIANLVRNFYIDFRYPTENAFKSLLMNVPAIPLRFKMSEVEN